MRALLRSLAATLALAAVLATSHASAGARTLCVFFVDLGTRREDPFRDAVRAKLLEEGCIAQRCGEDVAEGYAIRDDLPAGVTVDLVRAALRGGPARAELRQ